MGLLSKILGSGTAIKTVGGMVDDAFLSPEERARIDAGDLSDARRSQMGGFASKIIQFYGMTECKPIRAILVMLLMLDFLIDAASRIIRPWVTIHLLGGVFNYWSLPTFDGIDPAVQSWVWIVLTFWFGGRTITKDLIPLIKAYRKLRK